MDKATALTLEQAGTLRRFLAAFMTMGPLEKERIMGYLAGIADATSEGAA